MFRWRVLRLVVLALLLGILATIASRRGFGLHLGGAPAALQGPHSTEEAWILDAIVRDITEMSAYPAKPLDFALAPVPGGYRVSLTTRSQAVDVDLSQNIWAPAEFAKIVRAAIPSNALSSRLTPTLEPVHPALLDLSPASLVATSAALSRRLANDMRDPWVHEAAALTVAAFALRESAARSGDTRWAMNRMAAHLAMAIALRGGVDPGTDAQLAEAVLLILANSQRRALQIVDALQAGQPSPAAAAWTRALRMRITQDWRTMSNPAAATPLESYEYFRARRDTVTNTRGRVELAELGIGLDASWLRIMASAWMGVEDGWLLTEALDWERREYEDVFRRMHGRPIDPNPSDALNTRATRCIGDTGPALLPWGAWAEFAQRHLAMFVGRADGFYRHSLRSDRLADAEKARLRRELGALWMFPAATIWWTKGPRGGEADLTYINEAIDAAVEAPERVTARTWSFLELGARYEAVRRGMPPARAWFAPPTARMAYDAASRVKDADLLRHGDDLTSMLREAPHDYLLATEYLRVWYGEKPPYDELRRVYGARMEYDLRVLRAAREQVKDEAVRIGLLQRSCELSPPECVTLAREHAMAERDDEAAAAYERAFADPLIDAVALSNASGWLVSYYYRQGRTHSAIALAERSAATRSFNGLVTAAYLYERLGRTEDAEAAYLRAASRYDNPSPLLGFYYRAVNVRKEARFESAWKAALARVFPGGLVAAASGDTRPAAGVIVTKDNERVRTAGLQAGDIIVGLEGWRVDNLQQYRAVNAFYETDAMKLTVWRGKLFTVAITAPSRLMGIEFRSYPIQGWSER